MGLLYQGGRARSKGQPAVPSTGCPKSEVPRMRLGFAVSFRASDHRKHIAGIKPWYGFQNQGFGG